MYCEAVSFFIFESYSLFHIQQKEKYADISVFLFRKNSLFHKITRTPFHLLIDLTHIFANYSTCQQNGSANKMAPPINHKETSKEVHPGIAVPSTNEQIPYTIAKRAISINTRPR